VSWAWYAGAWRAALEGAAVASAANFQFHHQPFNYFAAYAPGPPRAPSICATAGSMRFVHRSDRLRDSA